MTSVVSPRTWLLLVPGIAVTAPFLLDGQSSAQSRPGKQVAPQVVAQREAAPPKAASQDNRKPTADAGWIGLMFGKHNGTGVEVIEIFPGGPAAFGGLRKGDVIVGIAGVAPKSVEQAVKAVEQSKPGAELEIVVARDGERVKLTANVGSLDRFHRSYMQEMLSRDPRHPSYTKFHGISDRDMQIEVNRRLMEQNRRLDYALHDVMQELKTLRSEVAELRGKKSR